MSCLLWVFEQVTFRPPHPPHPPPTFLLQTFRNKICFRVIRVRMHLSVDVITKMAKQSCAPLKCWPWRIYFNQNISTTHPNQHPTCSCPSSSVVLWFSRQNRWTWFLELLVKYAFNISLTSYIMLFLFILHNSSSSRHVFHMLSWVITVHKETRLKGRKQLLPNETEMMTLIDELKEEVCAVTMSNTGLCSLWNSGLT